MKPSSAKSI